MFQVLLRTARALFPYPGLSLLASCLGSFFGCAVLALWVVGPIALGPAVILGFVPGLVFAAPVTWVVLPLANRRGASPRTLYAAGLVSGAASPVFFGLLERMAHGEALLARDRVYEAAIVAGAFAGLACAGLFHVGADRERSESSP